jgi:hypothetical protein
MRQVYTQKAASSTLEEAVKHTKEMLRAATHLPKIEAKKCKWTITNTSGKREAVNWETKAQLLFSLHRVWTNCDF